MKEKIKFIIFLNFILINNLIFSENISKRVVDIIFQGMQGGSNPAPYIRDLSDIKFNNALPNNPARAEIIVNRLKDVSRFKNTWWAFNRDTPDLQNIFCNLIQTDFNSYQNAWINSSDSARQYINNYCSNKNLVYPTADGNY